MILINIQPHILTFWLMKGCRCTVTVRTVIQFRAIFFSSFHSCCLHSITRLTTNPIMTCSQTTRRVNWQKNCLTGCFTNVSIVIFFFPSARQIAFFGIQSNSFQLNYSIKYLKEVRKRERKINFNTYIIRSAVNTHIY